jgi:FKBP-type peptidyl-prolyl cis-trans isomerase
VTIADQTFKKNVAFKLGSRPFTSVVCAGLEEGIMGMRVGGRRKLTIPLELGLCSQKYSPQ